MELLNDQLWLHIRREGRVSTRMSAAIAYITDSSVFTLREGDCMVVNASDGALAAGSTCPQTLRECLKAGVALYSCPTLHAKAIAFESCAIVGSMNASASSQSRLIECAFLTRDVSIVTQTREFIEHLAKSATRIDAEFLDRATDVYVKPIIHSASEIESASQRKLWFLDKCPNTSRRNLRAYFIALIVEQLGDLKAGEVFVLWPNVKNMSQHEKSGRLIKVGTRYQLTTEGVGYFSSDDQWPEPWRLARFVHAITTGDQTELPDDLSDKTLKPFFV